MIRLACYPKMRNTFILVILGKNTFNNSRVVHLDTGVYVCKSVALILNDLHERFDFKYTEDCRGLFKAKKDGKYILEITPDMTLVESSEKSPYFIEVISNGVKQTAKVVLANGT